MDSEEKFSVILCFKNSIVTLCVLYREIYGTCKLNHNYPHDYDDDNDDDHNDDDRNDE